ncbi:MAG: right-handed parallel beta-helix repeat-containing protein [Deltaproteobacteria bacterium]|nr:right-handed parallel beta-helix repeat-containing protein [Deltaproteobacteria bacterium]
MSRARSLPRSPRSLLPVAIALVAPLLLISLGCGSDDTSPGQPGGAGGSGGADAAAGGASGQAGKGGGGGQAGKGGAGGVAGKAGSGGTNPGGAAGASGGGGVDGGGVGGGGTGGDGGAGGAGGTGGVGGTGGAGGSPAQCPGKLTPVDTSVGTHTVGTGTPASCTESALRAATDAVTAAGSGSVVFDCGGAATITLSSALAIGSSKSGTVILDGGGVITLSGGNATRILDLDNYTNLVVQRITLKDGFVAANEPDVTNKPSNSGAAIRHPWFGTLKAIDSRFENNHCAGLNHDIGGGAIFAGGLTEATLSGCQFVNNSASNGGGILNRTSTLTIIGCLFQGNGALSAGNGQFGNGGGVYIDGMYDQPYGDLTVCGTVFQGNIGKEAGSAMFSYYYGGSGATILDSVFDGNKFDNAGTGLGALYHEGNSQLATLAISGTTFSNSTGGEHAGAIFLGQNSEATFTNCTFANNKVSGNGAGLFNGAAIAHFVSCTLSGNDADYGPAIFKGNNATVTLKNTVFSNNTTANQYSATSCHAALTDQGGNMQWPKLKPNSGNPDQPCVAGITFADPLLQPLGDNGGPSQTFALGAGSPAIDFATDCPAVDQRGLPRSSPCDSGSFEVQ